MNIYLVSQASAKGTVGVDNDKNLNAQWLMEAEDIPVTELHCKNIFLSFMNP